MKHRNHLLILILAVGALIFATGCKNVDVFAWAVGYHPENDDAVYYELRCDPTTKYFSLSVLHGDSFGHFTPDYTQIGKPCVPSNENKSRPSTVSEPVSSPAANP